MWIVSYYVACIRCCTRHDNAKEALEHFKKLEKDFRNVDCAIDIEGKEYMVIWNYEEDFVRP